jgi:hypothetical protein
VFVTQFDAILCFYYCYFFKSLEANRPYYLMVSDVREGVGRTESRPTRLWVVFRRDISQIFAGALGMLCQLLFL